jgi:tetratricopeptide (TPR) repeat protein
VKVWAAIVSLVLAFSVRIVVEPAGGLEVAQAAPSCAYPDALATAGETTTARGAYIAILKSDPTSQCAKAGLTKLNRPAPTPASCSAADRLFDQGKVDEAAIAYQSLGSSTACALTGLIAVRDVKRLCEEGKKDIGLGRRSDAETAFSSALAKSPNYPCARNGLNAAVPAWYHRFLAAFIDWTRTSAEIILIGVAGLFALLLLAYFPRFKAFYLKIPRVKAIIGPRLTFEALDDGAYSKDSTAGPPLLARIRERIDRMRDESRERDGITWGLDFGTPTDQIIDIVAGSNGLKASLDSAGEISSQTKLVAALLSLLYTLLPIDRLTVSGVLAAPSSDGPAATFALAKDGRLAGSVTISGIATSKGQDVKAADYALLAEPAAVWLQYEIARALITPKQEKKLTGATLKSSAGESFALVREGLDRHLRGDDPGARDCFVAAIDRDPENWAAWMNRAVIEARLSHDFYESAAVLTQALILLEASQS